MTKAELFQAVTDRRDRIAAKLKRVRSFSCPLDGKSLEDRQKAMREITAVRNFVGLNNAPAKPTAQGLAQEALGSLKYAETGWESHDTESYSACGWDDAQAQMRDDARKYGECVLVALCGPFDIDHIERRSA